MAEISHGAVQACSQIAATSSIGSFSGQPLMPAYGDGAAGPALLAESPRPDYYVHRLPDRTGRLEIAGWIRALSRCSSRPSWAPRICLIKHLQTFQSPTPRRTIETSPIFKTSTAGGHCPSFGVLKVPRDMGSPQSSGRHLKGVSERILTTDPIQAGSATGQETSGSVLVRRKQRTCSEVSRLKWGSNTQDTQPVDYIVEAKLRPPPARPEWLVRTRLLEQLQRATRRAVTLIAAPAGYGKTTVVAQWLASPARPEMVAWISLKLLTTIRCGCGRRLLRHLTRRAATSRAMLQDLFPPAAMTC